MWATVKIQTKDPTEYSYLKLTPFPSCSVLLCKTSTCQTKMCQTKKVR